MRCGAPRPRRDRRTPAGRSSAAIGPRSGPRCAGSRAAAAGAAAPPRSRRRPAGVRSPHPR
ncbi:hypothetical protein ACFFX0_10495 [Citricoccus parietis]|uniref:Uncharacterized protein n=1 Tax=Citricoccus parietis TaxID=592307 RepID=A0ABV5FY47_9MICC